MLPARLLGKVLGLASFCHLYGSQAGHVVSTLQTMGIIVKLTQFHFLGEKTEIGGFRRR